MMKAPSTVEVQEVSDPEELLRAREQREQFDRNSKWLQQNIADIYARHRGKCICVAGQEVFIADTARDAIAQAMAAHPDDHGWYTRYIPKDRVVRV